MEHFWETVANILMVGALTIVGGIIVVLSIWSRWSRYDDYARQLQEEERRKYRAVDFGGRAVEAPPPTANVRGTPGARAAGPPADMAPLTPLPVNAALAGVVADHRPRWARRVEQALVGLVCVAAVFFAFGSALWDPKSSADVADAEAAVAEVLEMNGFAAPKVEHQWFAIHCRYNSAAYRWSAMGARGRACACFSDGEIDVKVDRSWGRLPTPFEGSRPPPP